jgi:hypothetical protein
MATVAAPSIAEDRAAKGADLLDRERPGWAGKIDRKRLEIWRCSDCVLGQTFGGFGVGFIALGLNVGKAVAHGFALDPDVGSTELRDAWLAEIERRLSAASR